MLKSDNPDYVTLLSLPKAATPQEALSMHLSEKDR